METKEYLEKVMQDYSQYGKSRNLSTYCKDEGIDNKWLTSYRRTYKPTRAKATAAQPELVPLQVPSNQPPRPRQTPLIVLNCPFEGCKKGINEVMWKKEG